LASLLRDLLLAGVAPDRLDLTSVSPQLRPELPDVARRIGKARLLYWQAQLKGSEQQLRLSVQPRLWLEVLLLGLLAEPLGATAPAPAAGAVTAQPPSRTSPSHAPAPPPAAPASGAPAPAPAAPPAPAESVAAPPAIPLPDLWQQILASLALPSTRMLLSQQAQLVRLDDRRAVVRVAGNWMAMVQSRLPLLEQAITTTLGQPRQLVLEGGGETPAAPTQSTAPSPPVAAAPPEAAPPEVVPAAAVPPPPPSRTPAPTPLTTPPTATQITAPVSATTEPAAQAPLQAQIDQKAQRLADFFNGDVVELDSPIGDPTPEINAAV
jgi:DNA polymerase-3 subunit gamma/tau